MRDLLDGYGNVQKTPCKNLVFFVLSCVRSSIEIRSAIAAVWKGSHLDMIGVLCGCYLVRGSSSKNHEHQNSNAGFLGAYFRHSQKIIL